MQLLPSPSGHKLGATEGDFASTGILAGTSPSLGMSMKRGFAKGSAGKRSASTSALEVAEEVAEVRALGVDEPFTGEAEVPRSAHEALMIRLKSRTARQEAEASRPFLAAYRSSGNAASEADLDKLLKATSERAEELRLRSEELQTEAADAERRLEKEKTRSVGRATEAELQAMNPFERTHKNIQEKKREEELQRQKDEAQANFAKVHRRLQSELIELRDFKVLLREFRRARLEKLQDTLGRVSDGRRLRACVREMVRHGAQRILQRLESADLPLEPWMCEVLVNCCHLEIRIEDSEEKLLRLRRQALLPVKADIQDMLSQTKQDRFENLCARAWGSRSESGAIVGDEDPDRGGGNTDGNSTSCTNLQASTAVSSFQKTVPEPIATKMRAVEADIAALRRLLADMRRNAAAVICTQIRQAEKAGGSEAGREAAEWGRQTLAMLVSEDFAKTTMKELQKSAPHAKLTH